MKERGHHAHRPFVSFAGRDFQSKPRHAADAGGHHVIGSRRHEALAQQQIGERYRALRVACERLFLQKLKRNLVR
jgi:hypothetical protein